MHQQNKDELIMDELMLDELKHYGTPHDGLIPHSGRFKYGSGKEPYQRGGDIYNDIKKMEKEGISQVEIVSRLGLKSTQELRDIKTISLDKLNAERDSKIFQLYYDDQWSKTAIAKKLGITEGTVRNVLKRSEEKRQNKTQKAVDDIKDVLKDRVKYLDVGKGIETQMGISDTQLKAAVKQLKDEGYAYWTFSISQPSNPNHKIPYKVLCPPGTTYGELRQNQDKIMQYSDIYDPTREPVVNTKNPVRINPSRIMVRWKEDGGDTKDGTIELRPGVKDLTLGGEHYAQVRIAVDGDVYLKGMAIENPNFKAPKGVDVIFNTSKSKANHSMINLDDPDHMALKKMKDDPNNPFGSTIRKQPTYIDSDGKEKVSACNIVNDEDDWGKWSINLASQFLSKQKWQVAEKQLNIDLDKRKAEFEEIKSITNETIKKKLLQDFAEECDSAAVNLKAAAFPRQSTKVILPVDSLKPNEIYCPTLNNGEEVILVRYPHAGLFEIPRLIVNNNNKEARQMLGRPELAVGINSEAAKQLSGADFDGDTVVVIPTKGQKLLSNKPLPGLQNFDHQEQYSNDRYPGMPRVKEKGPGKNFDKQMEMGKISNLITDMTIKGAPLSEIERAVKHSMVIIDAAKHNLNWQQSERDNGIKELKKLYQGGANRGASTIISMAKSEKDVDARKQFNYRQDKIDKETGEKIYDLEGTYEFNPATGKRELVKQAMKKKRVKNEDGTISYIETNEPKQTKSTKMAETKDAFSLIGNRTPTDIETVFGRYANSCKALGNEARKAWLSTGEQIYSPTARKAYSKEYSELQDAIKNAMENKPNERKAQLMVDFIVKEKKRANPDLWKDKDELKKIVNQELSRQRSYSGTHKKTIFLTDRQWEAIQAGAITKTMLQQLMTIVDADQLRQLATPRDTTIKMNKAAIAKAKRLFEQGYTQAEIAENLGVSASTVSKALSTQ